MISGFPPLFALFILWNLAAFLMVMLDKRRARRNEWRIRERTFFACAAAFEGANRDGSCATQGRII